MSGIPSGAMRRARLHVSGSLAGNPALCGLAKSLTSGCPGREEDVPQHIVEMGLRRAAVHRQDDPDALKQDDPAIHLLGCGGEPDVPRDTGHPTSTGSLASPSRPSPASGHGIFGKFFEIALIKHILLNVPCFAQRLRWLKQYQVFQ
jgi:hypothetical protein